MQKYCQDIHLTVDLDGTLILTDMLHESAALALKSRPLDLLHIPEWLRAGKSHLKACLAERVTFDPALLPYNQALLELLRAEKAKGRRLVLCTATHEKQAQAIADHLGLFDEVMATNAERNLAGDAKAQALVERFGEQGFDYAGNSQADIPVWKHARRAVVVNASSAVEQAARGVCDVELVLPGPKVTPHVVLRAIRLHQWLKNVLLFAPAIAAHTIANPAMWGHLLFAFLAFGLCASSVYVINDVLDLESDRRHPRKRKRPIASGQLSIACAALLAPALLLGSFVLAACVNAAFLAMLFGYFCLTLAYSFGLKRLVLIDCITLAMLYTTRVIAGGLAVDIGLSFWLLTFSIFLFLNLAFVKRYAELFAVAKTDKKKAHGRAYLVSDLPLLQTFGVSSGYTAVLILALYLNSDTVRMLYQQPSFLWLTLPILIFWTSWLWMKAHRGQMHDDPVMFAVRDRASLASGAAFALVLFLASF